MVKLEIENKSI